MLTDVGENFVKLEGDRQVKCLVREECGCLFYSHTVNVCPGLYEYHNGVNRQQSKM